MSLYRNSTLDAGLPPLVRGLDCMRVLCRRADRACSPTTGTTDSTSGTSARTVGNTRSVGARSGEMGTSGGGSRSGDIGSSGGGDDISSSLSFADQLATNFNPGSRCRSP